VMFVRAGDGYERRETPRFSAEWPAGERD
jgi:hypothetical protein